MFKQTDLVNEYGVDIAPDKRPSRTESVRSIWSTSDAPSICTNIAHDVVQAKEPIKPVETKVMDNEDTCFRNNIKVRATVEAKTVSATEVFAQNITASMLTVSGATRIVQNSIYLEGTGGSTGSTFTLTPNDAVDVIYANPINGTVNIVLGAKADSVFFVNQLLTVKDVTLEFGPASSYNVNIRVKSPMKIEHYSEGGLTAGTGAAYSLNTSGGSVSLRYTKLPVPGCVPTWVIQDQFIGNPRLFGRAGITFLPADEEEKMALINAST